MIEKWKSRFEQNMPRHADISWEGAEARLRANPEALAAVAWMEETGGEPDVIGREGERILFADCAQESPAGRRSLCYDEEALRARKKNPPVGSVEAQAARHGVTLMTE